MKYLEASFSTMAPPGEEYRDNWDRIFGKKIEAKGAVDSFGVRIPEEAPPRRMLPTPDQLSEMTELDERIRTVTNRVNSGEYQDEAPLYARFVDLRASYNQLVTQIQEANKVVWRAKTTEDRLAALNTLHETICRLL